MNISEVGKNLIKSYEGCYLQAYLCPSNVWTIGWGHTGDVYPGQVITQQQADDLFTKDIKRYEVPSCYGEFNQNQFDALTSFAYNCGMSALDDVLTSGDITGTMKLYNKGNSGILPGLVRRREEEISLFNTPIIEEEVFKMKNAICYCNEVDERFAKSLRDFLGADTQCFDARIPMNNWNKIGKNIIAVGGDNPKKGEVNQFGFSGSTTHKITGNSRFTTEQAILNICKGTENLENYRI